MKKLAIFAIPLVLFLIIPVISFSEQIESPKKQMEKGIAPEQIICKEGMELIIRNNGFPACVKHDTAIKFELLGAKIIPQSKKPEHAEPQIEATQPKVESLPSDTVTSKDCSGSAQCFTGTVTSVTDGDTIDVDGIAIRFALSSAPELGESDGEKARELINLLCPRGSEALVDEDEGQTQRSYGRILAVVYCNGVNLNSELLDSGLGYLASGFCDQSEFASTSWAKKYGCLGKSETSTPKITSSAKLPSEPKKPKCDPSYPDFCIASPPPDLDCNDIPNTNFRVLQPDPHHFEGDKDGIGCEKSTSSPKQSTTNTDCDPSYPDFCIPPPPPDLDCKDIPYKRFTVLPPDPHRFDGDKDGIGCES